jgi:hypothetical protein
MPKDMSSITIKGEEIPIEITKIEVHKLRFFEDNPRVYSVVHAGGKSPSQEEIQTKLRALEHVKQLIHDIKSNDGLIDPLIVKSGSFEVLEGNSRLAAYMSLIDIDPIKWGLVKCWLLPEDISEKQIYSILGQYHLKGKKDWAPYEQAGFLYRRHKNQNVSIQSLNEEVGLGIAATQLLINTYEFMLIHGEDNINRWSYYEEYLKSKLIKKVRDQFPEMDKTIVEKIRSGDISRAVDIREKLKVVCKSVNSNLAIVKKFTANKISLDSAFERTEGKGFTSATYLRLHRFRSWVVSPETRQDIKKAEGAAKGKMTFEIKKIHGILEKYL